MAEEIIFKVGVNTGNTAKDLQNIDKELKKVDNSAKEIGTDGASKFEALNKKVEAGGLTVREYTKAVKEYQSIALEAGRTSPIGQEAIKRAGELKDTIGDLATEVKNAGTDGANMQAALQLGSTVVAGYGALQGAMALMGEEGEDLQKTFVKLQAVQSVLAGIEQIRANLEKESLLVTKAKTVATYIQTAAEKAYALTVGTSTGAIKAMRIAMMALPIFLIIAGIMALAGAFDMFSSASDKTAENLKKGYDGVHKSIENLNKAIVKNGVAQDKATDKALKNLDREAKSRIAMGENEIKVARDINNQKLILLQTAIEQDRAAVRGLNNELAILEATKKRTEQIIIQGVTQARIDYANSLTDIGRSEARKKEFALLDQLKTFEKENKQATQETNKELYNRTAQIVESKDIIEDLKIAQLELNKTENDEAKKSSSEKLKIQKDLADKLREQRDLQFKAEQEQRQLEIDMIAQMDAKALEAKKLKAQEEYDTQQWLSAMKIKGWEEQAAAEVETEKATLASKQFFAEQAFSVAEQGIQSLGALASGNERISNALFVMDKALAIGKVVVNTIKSNAAIRAEQLAATSAATAIGGPAAGALKFAQFVPLINANRLSAVGNIAALGAATFAKFKNGGGSVSAPSGGGAVGGGGNGEVPTPQPQATTTQTAGLQGGTQQVVLVDSEVTAQQKKTNKVEMIASFK